MSKKLRSLPIAFIACILWPMGAHSTDLMPQPSNNLPKTERYFVIDSLGIENDQLVLTTPEGQKAGLFDRITNVLSLKMRATLVKQSCLPMSEATSCNLKVYLTQREEAFLWIQAGNPEMTGNIVKYFRTDPNGFEKELKDSRTETFSEAPYQAILECNNFQWLEGARKRDLIQSSSENSKEEYLVDSWQSQNMAQNPQTLNFENQITSTIFNLRWEALSEQQLQLKSSHDAAGLLSTQTVSIIYTDVSSGNTCSVSFDTNLDVGNLEPVKDFSREGSSWKSQKFPRSPYDSDLGFKLKEMITPDTNRASKRGLR